MVELGSGKKVSPRRRADVPFPAVVGQDELKTALLAVAANADLDGLLVRGEKGTAKSTTARALVDLLPEQRAVADCPYGCPPDDESRQCADCRTREDPPVETRPVPFVTLPLGASRERVVGSLSVAEALDGEAEFNPGLLARANRGVLYVDEVNLLDDHLVDVLLDAAAAGVNHVERDGVSVSHPAEFTLVGTMNPEEGSLRPQFRDRFALQVDVAGAEDLDDRVEILDRALSGFDGDHADDTAAVRDRLLTARDLLPDVDLPADLAASIAELCRDAGVDGHRADIATARAARTLAALDGRPTVIESDVRNAAELALPHRLQSRPFEDAPDPEDVVDNHFNDGDGEDEGEAEHSGPEADDAAQDGGDGAEKTDDRETDGRDGSGPGDQDDAEESGTESDDSDEDSSQNRGPAPEPSAAGGEDGESEKSDPDSADENGDGGEENGEGDGGTEEGAESDEATPLVPGQSRTETVDPGAGEAPDVVAPEAEHASDGGRARASPSTSGRGPRVRTERADTEASGGVDAAASVRAAAARGGEAVQSRDLRQSVRAGQESALVVFAVDASASMRGPMRATKGVALDVLRDAYERRDEVSVITFAGEDADVVLPPTNSVDLAARHLKELPTGDRTPLPAGLGAANEVLARADPETAVVILVTDGRATAGTDQPTADTREAAKTLDDRGAHVLVVDAGDGGRTSLVDDVVEAADGEKVPLDALTPERVDGAVQRATGGDGS
jgi:magnesium chelatase subunit D